MCRYKRAKECSKEMHSTRMCKACLLESAKERSRKQYEQQQREQLTIGQMIELHKNSFMARAWV